MFSIEIKNLSKRPVGLKVLRRAAEFTAQRLHLDGELSLVLAGDRRLQSLNQAFLGKDKPTDVLSFRAPVISPGALGEIFINLSDCRRPQKYLAVFGAQKSFTYILLFLMIHGLLHLAGDDDATEKERLAMISKGERIMKELVKNAIIKENL
ncbi:MAG TPA: rRNA maturation RNase YbeY [bacterium]|nr:rRNA maturation RNase YbeY [bacterium]HQB76502.1 rRNA maturation RNase YbeY [bacterium]HQO11350.1 rRNA maturation RNase YbeY [bacterium]